MAWEKHGNRRYYYKSVRVTGKVRKVYLGTGAFGNLAAGVEAARRARRQADGAAVHAFTEQLAAVTALSTVFSATCELLASASLLAAGYHRPSRHPWRSWKNGRQALHAAD